MAKVSVIRLCGTISDELPPFCDFPSRLANIVRGSVHLVHGGCRFDGKSYESVDEDQIRRIVKQIRNEDIGHIVVLGIFSPTSPDQEKRVRDIIHSEFEEVSVSLSHEIGSIGLIERENATILNECLKPLCKKTLEGFSGALEAIGVTCPIYLTQNDGTIISREDVLKYPVFTFASGPTNSMRGALFLSDKKDAIVVDIGGTTTDVGILKDGFPRQASSHVKVGGVKTNFRMPDVVSIGLGGGSYVHQNKSADGTALGVTVGPLSAGMKLKREALIFAEHENELEDRSLTASDIAVAAGFCSMGDKEKVKSLDSTLVKNVVDEIYRMIEGLIDKIKLSKEDVPVIIVGGGSVLLDANRPLKGATEVIIPKYFGVANAIGAALSKISITTQETVNLLDVIDTDEMEKAIEAAKEASAHEKDQKDVDFYINEARKPFLMEARHKNIDRILKKTMDDVVKNGGRKDSLEVLEKHDSVLAYLPGNVIEIKVKVVGDLARVETTKLDTDSVWKETATADEVLDRDSTITDKQTVSATGQRIGAKDNKGANLDARLHPKEPFIDGSTGEWILSEWDIECIVVGAGIYGCGGGGSPHIGRLRCLKRIRDGGKIRVVNPEKLLKNDANQIVILSAFIGAPLVMYEQGISSTETTTALETLRDVYEIGNHQISEGNGKLQNTDGSIIETTPVGVRYIKNYQPPDRSRDGHLKVVGLMAAEIGGMNGVEPLIIASNLDMPVLDGDAMSRAFPEVHMIAPYMLDKPPYPVTIVGSGNCSVRTVVEYCPTEKSLENFLRTVTIENGCSAGLAIALDRNEVMTKTCLHTVSSAWRLGDAILRARLEKESVIETIIRQEKARLVTIGKISDVGREITGGFNRGHLTIEGIDEWAGLELLIEFQNEYLVLIPIVNGEKGKCLGSVPDLIALVDADTAEPITTDDIRYGLRVAVFLMPSHNLLRHPKSLKWVSPQAFHYPDSVQFEPYEERPTTVPIPPVN